MFDWRKRVAAVVAGVILVTGCPALMLTGCGSEKNWQEAAQQQLPDALSVDTLGTVYVNGEILRFPLTLSELLNHKWKYPENYQDIEKETLDPHYSTGEFALTSGKKNSLTITATNAGEETIALADCFVESMTLKKESGEVMLPGGMYIGQSFSSREEIAGKVPSEFTTDGLVGDTMEYTAFYISAEGYSCRMTLRFRSEKGAFQLFEIKFQSDFTPASRSTLSETLDAVIKKNDTGYAQFYDDSEAFIAESRRNLIVSILKVYGFDADTMSDEQFAKLDTYFMTITANTIWSITEEGNMVSVDFSYPNLEEQMDAAYETSFDTLLAQDGVEEVSPTDPLLMSVFIDELCAQASSSQLVSGGHFTFEKDPATNSISDDDFSDLLFSIMGLYDFVGNLRAA